MDEPGLATEPTSPPAAATVPAPEVVAAIPPAITRAPRRRARQTRVVLRKVGPWSVFKFSLLFYLCVMTVILLALAMLYGILGAVGALEHVTEFARNLFADKSFSINGGWIFARKVLLRFVRPVTSGRNDALHDGESEPGRVRASRSPLVL